MALTITRKQANEIRAAWTQIEVAVESNTQQEQRLKRCLRVSMKSFGPVLGRFHLIREIHDGCIGLADRAILAEKSHDYDERILAYVVGNWIRARGRYGIELRVAIERAMDAYLEAQKSNG